MSWKERIYRASPIWLQNIFTSFEGNRRRKLRIDNRFFRKWSSIINEISKLKYDDILKVQEENLSKYLSKAFSASEYWNEKLSKVGYRKNDNVTVEDLKNFVLIDKNTVNVNKGKFFNKYQSKKDYVNVHTSGTTGAGLNFRWSKEALGAEFAFYWSCVFLRNKIGDRYGTFNGNKIVPKEQDTPPFWRRNKPMNQTLFSIFHMNKKNLSFYCNELQKKDYLFLNGYPSAIYELAIYMSEHEISIPTIKAIYTSSEILFNWQREIIESVFPNAKVFDLYTNGEQSIMISQCEYGKYHVYPLFSAFWFKPTDILIDGKKAYEPIGTSTLNDSTFLINYKTNDLVLLSEDNKCGCNNKGPIIYKIIGRESDVVTTSDGNKIGPAALSLPLKYSDEIKEAQIIQEDYDEIHLLVVLHYGSKLNSEETIREEMASRLGNSVKIKIHYADQIEKSDSGKFKPVISKL